MNTAEMLLIALLLDAVFGEPKAIWNRVPHPAVLMGNAIGWCDRKFNTSPRRFEKGMAVTLILSLVLAGAGFLVAKSSIGSVISVALAAILIAQNSLAQHVYAVADNLRRSVEDGRQSVAMIVGRDTKNLSDSAVARSAIESAAENFSDGVIAPAFWFLIAGLPGLLVYKLINTADSMIGYRTAQYEQFGKFAARADDVLNYIPARLSAGIILVAMRVWTLWAKVLKDAPLHRSPNAGWPEAAMAHALDISLSGPRSYDGEMREFPWVNEAGSRDLGPKEIDRAVNALWAAWIVVVLIVAAIAVAT